MKRTKMLAAAILALLFGADPARAGGLRTPFGEVTIKNLKIGQTYSLKDLINFPLRVINTGSESVQLDIQTRRVPATSLKRGFEPVPDLSWVKVEQSTFTISPQQEAITDVVVSIPDDPKLLGRRFQADIWTRQISRSAMLLTAIDSRLLIEVSSVPPTPDELKKKFVHHRVANLDFTLFPTNAEADDVPLGVDYNLEKERKIAIKIVNPNDETLHFRIKSVPNWEALLHVPHGFEEAYDARWLRPKDELMAVPGNSIRRMGLIVRVPDEARYYGKAFFFPVAVEVLEQEIPAKIYYTLEVRLKNPAPAPKASPKP